MNKILKLGIFDVSSLIKNKHVSPVELTKEILKEIQKVNKTSNTFITICADTAINEAKKAEKDIMNGLYKSPLHGIPLSIKDNIPVKNTLCTSGSAIYKDNVSKIDAPIVKVLRSNKAIIIGKTNMDELANHVMGINKNYGTIKNPISPFHSIGGSSGGSAASVSSHLSYGSIGTDTTGSIRIPASCGGIVGLKPTYNRLTTLDVNPLSWSLDHVGVLAKNCKDLSLLFNAIVPGAKENKHKFNDNFRIGKIKIGIPENFFFDDLEKSVEIKINKVINLLSNNNLNVKSLKLPNLEKYTDAREVIIGTEAAYFHKYAIYKNKEQFESENYDFLEEGLTISQNEYYEALIKKQKITQDFQEVFSKVDILITPTMPIAPPELNEKNLNDNKDHMLEVLSRFTGPFNMNGLPALTIPIGLSSEGLPIGLQIVGNVYNENKLIYVGNWIMKNL